jgi:FkbM family methyltransferase
VYAFEPQKITYDLLLRNIEINRCRNVVAYRVALGHRNRLATTLGDAYELHGRVKTLKEPHDVHNYGGIGLGRGEEDVTMMTLDSYQLDKIGLVKIDVEGAERLVLRGAARTIESQRPYVVFEHHTAGLEAIFQARWNEMCEMYSLPAADGKASMFDLLTTEFGYPEIQRLDENNYLAIP